MVSQWDERYPHGRALLALLRPQGKGTRDHGYADRLDALSAGLGLDRMSFLNASSWSSMLAVWRRSVT